MAPENSCPLLVENEHLCQDIAARLGMPAANSRVLVLDQTYIVVERYDRVDVDRFLQANMFNWLICGTDAHAKNYSLLIGAGDEIRLAPLYDLSSQLPYRELIEQRLSMKIGDSRDIRRVGIADWRKLARDCMIEEERVLTMLKGLAKALPDEISAAREHALIEGLSESIIAPLARHLIAHVGERVATITAVRSSRSTAPTKARRGDSSG